MEKSSPAHFVDVLGIDALVGSNFSPEEDRTPRSHPVALISHGFWQRRLGSSPSVSQESIRLDGIRYSVVGVVAPSFTG